MKRSSVSTGGAGRLSIQELRSQDLDKPGIYTPQTYPFALSKSSLYAVGAPHTWPHIVAALVWLIDCIKIYRAMKESTPLFDDGQYWGEETEDGIIHNKLFLDYTIKCYESFMSGADTFEEMNAELQSKLKDLYRVDASKLESLAAENKALNEQIARLEEEREKEPNRLVSLKKLKMSLQTDVQKYKAYISSLESHSSILDQKLSGLDEEISRLELECEAMRQENARLQNIVDNQKYSVTDIERINHEKNELQQTINKLTKDLETEQQQMWNEELKYARGKEAIEAQLADYHKLARKLKLIPKGAENSKGYDFEIKFNPEAGAKCLVKYRAQVYVPLKELLNESEEEISKALNKKIDLENTLEQLYTMKMESRRNVRMLKEELQKLDDLYQQTVKVPLKELLNESEEEISKALNKKIALEDTLEQMNTMKTESRRNVRMLKEELQKLDDLYQQTVKVGAGPVCSSDSSPISAGCGGVQKLRAGLKTQPKKPGVVSSYL
ncbi:Kinetochore protein NDC80-like protein [Microtus ochrogaster]|uniref:Kinetochore protein NDC80 n=1 Tax=Microtus ochrogaster TaxID=79684 RepID=A0A8J6G4L7_MICOH|nr:Kinetochore protein NDC80-like protein [Microtus ochrogaster]